MNAPGTYGPDHAVNAIVLVRRKTPLVEGVETVHEVVRRTATHVTYRRADPAGPEQVLPVRTFDETFEAAALPQLRPMHPIPVSAAQAIAEGYGYDQVVIVARRIGAEPAPFGEHVTTYGRGDEHGGVAARIGQYLREDVLAWADSGSPDAASLEAAKAKGLTWGCALSIAHMLRVGSDSVAHEWWHACRLRIDELEALGVDDYDLNPIRQAFSEQAEGGAP